MENMKKCSICKDDKPATLEFFGSRGKKRGGLSSHCKECHSRQNRQRRRRQRVESLAHYSNGTPVCVCCGEGRVEFLCFDHIQGGGAQHRKSGGGVINIATWLKNQGFPDGFQVLCHNCNMSLGFYGYCPHREDQGRFNDLPEKKYPHSKLYCVREHKLFGDNIQIAPQSTGRGERRICRACKREAKQKNRQRQKENQ